MNHSRQLFIEYSRGGDFDKCQSRGMYIVSQEFYLFWSTWRKSRLNPCQLDFNDAVCNMFSESK